MLKPLILLVVPASEMTDANFRRHLEERHLPRGDFADLEGFGPSAAAFAADRPTFQTYHDRQHDVYGEEYDHEHD